MRYEYRSYPFGRWIKWAVAGLLVLIILISCISTYNGLVEAEQEVKRSWSQVENVMQRRADLITNLVEVVKGYVKHEEKVFGDIAAARAALMSGSGDIKSKMEADQQLVTATNDMLLLVENYPSLKASEQFINLQTELEGSENRVANERRRFIEAVEKYNLKVKRFPGNIFAKAMGFGTMDYFEAEEYAKKAPKVNFD